MKRFFMDWATFALGAGLAELIITLISGDAYGVVEVAFVGLVYAFGARSGRKEAT